MDFFNPAFGMTRQKEVAYADAGVTLEGLKGVKVKLILCS